jgi:hypothetical protein
MFLFSSLMLRHYDDHRLVLYFQDQFRAFQKRHGIKTGCMEYSDQSPQSYVRVCSCSVGGNLYHRLPYKNPSDRF